jgi:DNA-binding FadR family transcriptional regulator
MILSGELEPGDPLPAEDSFSGEPVSRTALREAVKVLAAKGLVESRPKIGTRVRERRFWNLLDPDVLEWRLERGGDGAFFEDIIELRRIIEPEAARLAAERASDDEIERLLETFHALEAAGSDEDRYLEPDLRFHALILEACHNELLAQVGSTLREALRAVFVAARSKESIARATPLHGRIAQAIAARDPAGAERATRMLIDDTARDVAKAGARRRTR